MTADEELEPPDPAFASHPSVPASPGRFLFTAEEVAQSLAVSTSLVRQLTLCGGIPCRRIGRLVRYTTEDIAAFVQDMDRTGYRGRRGGQR